MYTGYYINLDRNPGRRTAIEAELARNDLGPYTRFKAADGNSLSLPNPHLKNGEMGCFISHMLLLKENYAQDKHLHVIEDDIVCAPQTGGAIRWAIERGFLDQYDIILTDAFVPLLNDALKAYKTFYDAAVARDSAGNIARAAFSVIDMKDILFASTCSFLVGGKSAGKLHDLFDRYLRGGPALPVDLFIRRCAQEGVLRVGCLFPFVTSVRLDGILATNMEQRQDVLSSLAASLARYSFFIGCDWNLCRDYLQKYLPLPAADAHGAVLNHLLAFSLTGAYRAP